MNTDREEHRSESPTAVSDTGTTAGDSRQSDTAHRDQRRRFVIGAVTVPILLTLGKGAAEAGTLIGGTPGGTPTQNCPSGWYWSRTYQCCKKSSGTMSKNASIQKQKNKTW